MALIEGLRQLLTLWGKFFLACLFIFSVQAATAKTSSEKENLQIEKEQANETLLINIYKKPPSLNIETEKSLITNLITPPYDRSSRITPYGDPKNIANDEKHDWRTIFTGVSASIALISLMFNFTITSAHKQRDIRKSLYDDLLFREMFFKPFNEELNTFVQKWGVKDGAATRSKKDNEKFVTELGRLQDMTSSLRLLSKSAQEKLIELLDGLENFISSASEAELKARQSIYDIHKLLLSVQQEMIKEDFKNKKIQTKDFEVQ